MYKRERKRSKLLILLLGCVICLLGCGNRQKEEQQVQQEAESRVALAPGAYDSGDSAILVKKEEEKNELTFFNLLKGRKYTLEYDGSSRFYDKYGSAVSLSQLSEGELVELRFLKEKRKLVSAQASDKIWTMDGASKFDLDMTNRKIKIMEEWYDLSENVLVFSEGKQVELMDINAQDVLQIRGVDHTIYSIVIDKGHGYLRLTGDEYFIGGWIEVGQKIIRQIEEDMLLVIPEGSYEVFLSHSGIEGVKEVVINRNEETRLDVGDIRKDDLVKYGNLIFTVEPSQASVYLDGKSVDITRTVKAEYGLHQILVKAEGYETVIQYIKVSQSSANVSIKLDKEKDRTVSGNSAENAAVIPMISGNSTTAGSTVSGNGTVSGNTATGSTTGYKVRIEAPVDTEVYVDGSYIGIAPTSFAKKAGSYVVTIRKNGYQARSYTIEVDKEEKDISFSFSDLIPLDGTVSENGLKP